MGLKNSKKVYASNPCASPEECCQSLEEKLLDIYPNTFITLAPHTIHKTFSPRLRLPYIAMANLPNGKTAEVEFQKRGEYIVAIVEIFK